MKVLVTGGAGFLGSHTCGRLAQADHEVICYDLAVCPNDGVRSEIGSVMDLPALREAVQGVDAVIHAAAVLGVKNTDTRPRYTMDINVEGTRNVVDACGERRLIFLSSSEVYGDARRLPTYEDCPVNPKSVYAISKLAGEEYVKAAAGPWTILRLFNAFGAGQREDFVIPRFMAQARAGKPLTVYGEGKQRRAYCWASDIARAVEAALHEHAPLGEVFNVGNPANQATVVELARMIADMVGGAAVKLHASSDRGAEREIGDRLPAILKARQRLGWEPTTSLRVGLAALLKEEGQK